MNEMNFTALIVSMVDVIVGYKLLIYENMQCTITYNLNIPH